LARSGRSGDREERARLPRVTDIGRCEAANPQQDGFRDMASVKKLFLAIILLNPLTCLAQTDSKQLQTSLQSELLGKTFALRGFPVDDKIQLDSRLQPLQSIHPGSWTVANVEVEKIEVRNDLIRLVGARVGYAYDKKSESFQSIKQRSKIEVEIAGQPAGTPEEISKAIRSGLFLATQSEINESLPKIWKDFFTNKEAKKNHLDAKPVQDSTVAHIGNGVTPPKVIYSPDPEAPQFGNPKGHVTVLSVVINTSGQAENINLELPVGLACDESAIAVIQRWRFQPAMKGNQPVPVKVNIEMQIR
jgi:TonB family protein